MTLLARPLDEAREDLAAFERDAAELTTLLNTQTRELQELQATGARDFSRVADLEAKRAALATLLAQQQAEVNDARQRVYTLEAQARRDELLTDLERRTRKLAQYKQDTDSAILEWLASFAESVRRITQLRTEWAAERDAAVQLAADGLGLKPLYRHDHNTKLDEWYALVRELEKRGAPGAALHFTPYGATFAGDRSAFTQRYTAPNGEPLEGLEESHKPLERFFDRSLSVPLALLMHDLQRSIPNDFRGPQ